MSAAARDDEAVPITHAEKVLYPACGFTKGAVVDYYRAVAPAILPRLRRRPLTVRRFPDGVDGISFFEKRCPPQHPAAVSVAEVRSTSHGTIPFPVIDRLPALLWMANRAALELHPYLFRAGAEDAPVDMVFDLDPGPPATIAACLPVALTIRDLLRSLGLESWVKTSGSKGLHIVVPVTGASFASTKGFAHALGLALAQGAPDRITTVMAKAARRGKVFVDWSQNDHGKTTACAYTLRACPRPTVSTPLTWDEVEMAARNRRPPALAFEADQVRERLDRLGDLFAGLDRVRQRLPAAAALAEALPPGREEPEAAAQAVRPPRRRRVVTIAPSTPVARPRRRSLPMPSPR